MPSSEPGEPLMPSSTFRLVRETHDLKLAEGLREYLRSEGIGAVIVGDEAVQGLPPSKRYKEADLLKARFRIEVPVELHAAAVKSLRKLDQKEEKGA